MVQAFTDLIAWQEGHKLTMMIYKTTQKFPKEEMFGLTNQMRRAAVSVTSNISEGFNREHAGEKVQFYAMARGSIGELQSQLYVARDAEFISGGSFQEIYSQSVKVHKLVNGLIKSSKLIRGKTIVV